MISLIESFLTLVDVPAICALGILSAHLATCPGVTLFHVQLVVTIQINNTGLHYTS